MNKALSHEQVNRYREDGFVSPIRAMDSHEAARYRQRFEKYETDNDGWYELSKGQKLYLLQTWAAELANNDRVLDAVQDVLGDDIFVWGLSLFVKDAQSPEYVSWHQDSTYWGLSQPDVVTAWFALTEASEVNGCMKMLPGSHLKDQLEHRDTLHENNLLTRGQEVSVDVDESQAVLLPLQPGQVSLHHIRTVHASEPNRSDQRRIGVAVRYIAPHVKQIHAPMDSAWLVRGEDRHGNFVHETPPAADMDAGARAEYDRIMQIRQNILYRNVDGDVAKIEESKRR